jgi:hypothetical protein
MHHTRLESASEGKTRPVLCPRTIRRAHRLMRGGESGWGRLRRGFISARAPQSQEGLALEERAGKGRRLHRNPLPRLETDSNGLTIPMHRLAGKPCWSSPPPSSSSNNAWVASRHKKIRSLFPFQNSVAPRAGSERRAEPGLASRSASQAPVQSELCGPSSVLRLHCGKTSKYVLLVQSLCCMLLAL